MHRDVFTAAGMLLRSAGFLLEIEINTYLCFANKRRYVGLIILASWILQGKISKSVPCFLYEVGWQPIPLTAFSHRNCFWWVKPKCPCNFETSSFTLRICWRCQGCRIERWGQSRLCAGGIGHESSLHLFGASSLATCVSANMSLKFTVNLIDSSLILYLRKMELPYRSNEKCLTVTSLKNYTKKNPPFTKSRCGIFWSFCNENHNQFILQRWATTVFTDERMWMFFFPSLPVFK